MKKVAILDEIASETNGKSYKTYRYCFDGVDVPRMDYDDHKQQFTWKDHGETEYHDKPISLKQYADRIIVAQPPLFRFFLDGSRKTYKVDDMAYTNRVYPIIAGQVGIGCCERVNGYMFPLRSHERIMFWRDLVIALPKKAKSNDWVDDKAAEPLPQLPGHQSALYGQRHQPSYADGGRDRAYRNGRRELLLRPCAYPAKLQKSP